MDSIYKLLLFLMVFTFGEFNSLAQISKSNEEPKISINGIKISKSLLDDLKTETALEPEFLKFYFWKDSIIDTTNYGHWDTISHGIIFKNFREKNQKGGMATDIIKKFNERLRAEGNFIYLTHLTTLKRCKYDIAIIEAKDQFEAIKKVRTSSLNYDVQTDEIINQLMKWDKELKITVTLIDSNRIEATINKKPKNTKKFEKELYELCPNFKDGDLVKYFLKQKSIALWWD